MKLATEKTLIDLIADALYLVSANALPELCDQLGIRRADAEVPAMTSKRAHVRGRLAGLPMQELRRIGAAVIGDHSTYELEEALAHLEEATQARITDLTRRRIMKALNSFSISGEVQAQEFFAALWPTRELPYHRAGLRDDWTMHDAILQHLVRNDDFSSEDVLDHLGAMTCSQGRFFRLLEAAAHPRTRNDQEQERLADALNKHLERDGFELTVVRFESGSPIYGVRRAVHGMHPADDLVSEKLAGFDTERVHRDWQKALERRASDPQGAITAARTLLESVMKHILEETGTAYADKDDLPKLYRSVAGALQLSPDQHTEDAFKKILGGCQTVIENLANLRNRLGDAHGTGRKPARPATRHAELAVNLAGAIAVFLVATLESRAAPTALPT